MVVPCGGLDDPSSGRMEDCGVVDHEKLGGQWLSSLGFSKTVCDLVARHVDGKRSPVAKQFGCLVNVGLVETNIL